MAVDQEKSQSEVDDEFNRIVANNYDPEQDAIQRGFDEKFGSTAKHLQEQEQRAPGTEAGIDQAESYANDKDNATTGSIDQAREQENQGSGGQWQNNTSNSAEGGRADEEKTTGKKRKGPLVALLLSLVGGGSVLTILFSPGMLIVNFKEKLVEKFNDQLAVMDERTIIHVHKKFKGATTGVCTSKISIRCKFSTMSDRQLKKLEDAFAREGGKVNSEKTITGRNKIVDVEFNGKTIDANTFMKEIRGDPFFRGTWMRGYNPKLAGFADHIFSKLSKRIGIIKQKNVSGVTPDEMRENVLEAASGAAAAEADVKVSSKEEACSGGDDCVDGKRTVYIDDETGQPISKEEYDRRINGANTIRAELEARRTLRDTGGTIAKATLKGALTSTALGLGAVDSACTGYTLIRAVGFAAKYLGMLQLIRFAQVFMNTADRIKASYVPPGETAAAQEVPDAGEDDEVLKPEQVEYIGNILTSMNSKGQSATDSLGYQYAAYNAVPNMPRSDNIQAQNVSANGTTMQLSAEQQQQVQLNDEVTKYINGQLVSDNLLTNIISLVDGGGASTSTADEVCNFVKSGWGQTIVIGASLVGAVVAFFSGGVSLGWGAAVQAGVSVAIGVAIAMLQPKLVDMAAGTLIGDDELKNGNRAGNAAVSGMGGMNHMTSQSRGIPALKKQDFALVAAQMNDTRAQYAAVDRAMLSPFDPTNPNTFMGSFVSSLIPYTSKFSSVASGVSSMAKMTFSTFAGLAPNANAQTNSAAELEQCQDADYKLLSIAADPFCNIRHGMGKQTLSTDPDIPAAFMERGFVNPDTGEPLSSDNEYGKYVKNCMERETSIGAYTEDNDNTGEECIQGSASDNPARDPNCTSGDANANTECRRNMFRLYYIDLSISKGMDEGEVAANSATKPGGAVTGDARALAQQVASNPNIRFTSEKTREQLLLFSRGVEVYNACNEPMTVSKHLLGALLTNATKYSVLINNIGFREDRFVGCERGNYQHPKGTAVDLNDIQIIGGAGTGGEIEGPYGGDLPIVNQYATDFLAALPLNRGGVGQKNFGVNPTFPPGSIALNGSHLFDDGGGHLHIDARNRENLSDTE